MGLGFNGGNEGDGAGEEPTDSEVEPLDSEEEEEDKEEDNMADQNLEWMAWGPLALPDILHKLLRHTEKLLTKYDPDRAVKTEDHLNMFYLHLQTLEVCYDDVSCRLFPCTLDGRVALWYHKLPVNSIQSWGMFKRIFLENFAEDKTLAMLPKELGSIKME